MLTFLIMCIYEQVGTWEGKYPQKPEVVGSSGAGAAHSCEPSFVCLESSSCPLQKRCVVSVAEPSLQSLVYISEICLFTTVCQNGFLTCSLYFYPCKGIWDPHVGVHVVCMDACTQACCLVLSTTHILSSQITGKVVPSLSPRCAERFAQNLYRIGGANNGLGTKVPLDIAKPTASFKTNNLGLISN